MANGRRACTFIVYSVRTFLPSFLLPSARLRSFTCLSALSAIKWSSAVRCASFHAAFSRIVLTHSGDGERASMHLRSAGESERSTSFRPLLHHRRVRFRFLMIRTLTPSLVGSTFPLFHALEPARKRQNTERTNSDDQADGRIGDSDTMVERAREGGAKKRVNVR